jgi:single-strand DNA-binding protein
MSDLNSVLIEGVMKEAPLFRVTQEGAPAAAFSIVSERCYREGKTLRKDVCSFRVKAYSLLAKECRTKGHKGRRVRVVGCLKEEQYTGADGKRCNGVIIVAEHIEYRPG